MSNVRYDAGLMPMPRRVRLLEGPPIMPATPLREHYPAVLTPRIECAVGRFVDLWRLGELPIRSAPGETDAIDGRIDFVVDCAAASPTCPALGDDERYQLEIGAAGIRLEARTEWGVLRGLATLMQLGAGDAGLAPVFIDDEPRFGWRGLTLDVARHFIGIEALLRTLDVMAFYKLNVLHLHLSDDQAFRFASSAHPRLASNPAYSANDLARLVAHGAALGIRIVPELDMPGHVTSWLTAYPEWGCRPTTASRRFGVHKACLDPCNPAVYVAIGQLLAELAAVFPDQFLHIGGDEVHPAWWSTSAEVQAFMALEGLSQPADLQAWFNRRVAAMVTGLGRRAVAWDEVLHPALPAEVVVQTWRGATQRARALASGHDCIISANYYLDLFFPADAHYRFDPLAPEAELVALEDGLLEDPRFAHVAAGMRWTHQWREAVPADAVSAGRPTGRVLGAEACLWSELVDEATLDVRLWSRMPALAERFWSMAALRDVGDMRRRLRGSLAALGATGMLDLMGSSRALLARAGVGPDWQPLIDVLEPVKWYARLLGAEALAARLQGREMPLARPYQVDTPLDRVVDGLLPEAFAVTDLASLCQQVDSGDTHARATLRRLAETWRRLPRPGSGPAELEPLAERLARLGALVIERLDNRTAAARLSPGTLAQLAADAEPCGEYLLAAVPVIRAWLVAGASAGQHESRQ
jgi:hexosaminidase